MSDIDVTIDEVPVFVQVIETPLNFQIVTPRPLAISSTASADINVQVVNAPPVWMTVSLESGPPGPPGPPGPRGSLFLGGYPSLSNLPAPDGINIKAGDFAFVQDTSTIYEWE